MINIQVGMGQSPTVPSHLSDEGKETSSLILPPSLYLFCESLSFSPHTIVINGVQFICFYSPLYENSSGKDFLASTFVHNPEERAEAQVGEIQSQ